MTRVLLTGASGFLGNHLITVWPKTNITTLGTTPVAGFRHIKADLRKAFQLDSFYHTVVHAAGKAHLVPSTNEQKAAFHQVNVEGTANLLNALQGTGRLPRYFVFISSVAVYGLESGDNITEGHALHAQDPYGLSKIQAEQLISQWCDKFQVKLTILRLPLVIGNKPPGNLARMIQAVRRGRWVHINGGAARRSMVMASDVADIIPKAMEIGGTYNLTDGLHPSYYQLYREIAEYYHKRSALSIPFSIAKVMALIGDLWGQRAPINSKILEKLTQNLIFSDQRARDRLQWQPSSVLESIRSVLDRE